MDGLEFVKSQCFGSGRNTSFIDNSVAAVCLRNFRTNHETPGIMKLSSVTVY